MALVKISKSLLVLLLIFLCSFSVSAAEIVEGISYESGNIEEEQPVAVAVDPQQAFSELLGGRGRLHDGSCRSRYYESKGYCCQNGTYYSCKFIRKKLKRVCRGGCPDEVVKSFLNHSPSTKGQWKGKKKAKTVVKSQKSNAKEAFRKLLGSKGRIHDGSCNSRQYESKGYCCQSGIYYSCRFMKRELNKGKCRKGRGRHLTQCSQSMLKKFLNNSPSTKGKWQNSVIAKDDSQEQAEAQVDHAPKAQIPLPVKKPIVDKESSEQEEESSSKDSSSSEITDSEAEEREEEAEPATNEFDKLIAGSKVPPRSCNCKRHRKNGRTFCRDMFKYPANVCNSWVYSRSKNDVDAYIHPVTGCAFTAALESWNKNHCKSKRAGCTVRRGDISHKIQPDFNGAHYSHTEGYCIDIRPFTKNKGKNNGFSYSPTTISHRNYSSATTKKFLQHMRKFGSDVTFFNDRKIIRAGLSRHLSMHHNHIHICIKPGPTSRKACQNYLKKPPDLKRCPKAAGMVKYFKSRTDLINGKTKRNKKRCLAGK